MHEMCHALHSSSESQFWYSLVGDGSIEEFWHNALRDPWAKEHPAVMRNMHQLQYLLATIIHLDGAEVHRNSEIYFIDWGTMHSQASRVNSLDSRFLCAGVPHVLRVRNFMESFVALSIDTESPYKHSPTLSS